MYTVGDIIWVASTSYPSVKPYQIVEEIIHKTLKGTVKTFNVKAPAGNSNIVALEELDGDIFTDVDSLRTELNERASKAIEAMLDAGQGLIEKHFRVENNNLVFEGEENNTSDDVKEPINDSPEDLPEDYIVLPDGTRAKLKIKGDIL
jgi:hypothetical protein